MKTIELKLPFDLYKDYPILEQILKENESVHERAMHSMMVAQNKMLCEMAIHHNDFDVNNYELNMSSEYHSDTGRIDISFHFDYKPSDRDYKEADKFRINRFKHLCSLMSFYEDYELDHYRLEDRYDEHGKPYDCRIYYKMG